MKPLKESDEDSEETIFNFSKDMTDADKCKKLREEYTRWNRQTNNSNEKIRNQARKMVELTLNLRKIQLLMNNLDKFRYSYDDPTQLNISLKKNPYQKVDDFK